MGLLEVPVLCFFSYFMVYLSFEQDDPDFYVVVYQPHYQYGGGEQQRSDAYFWIGYPAGYTADKEEADDGKAEFYGWCQFVFLLFLFVEEQLGQFDAEVGEKAGEVGGPDGCARDPCYQWVL